MILVNINRSYGELKSKPIKSRGACKTSSDVKDCSNQSTRSSVAFFNYSAYGNFKMNESLNKHGHQSVNIGNSKLLVEDFF